MRGTSNANARGNSADRLRRRRWLVKMFESDVSQRQSHCPPTCRCYRCGELLTEHTVTVDRIIPGCRGGKYTRDNIRPACSGCNSETGGGIRS